MDVVTELAARATNYLLLLQEALAYQQQAPLPRASLPQLLAVTADLTCPGAPSAAMGNLLQGLCQDVFSLPVLRGKALDLVDSASALPANALGAGVPSPLTVTDKNVLFTRHALALLQLVHHHRPVPLLQKAVAAVPVTTPVVLAGKLQCAWRALRRAVGSTGYSGPPYPAPEYWRHVLRGLLYHNPAHREQLAELLDYIPALVYALHAAPATRGGGRPWREYLQLSDNDLEHALQRAQCAVPFEVVFTRELQEITARRADFGLPTVPGLVDPQQRADQLALCGLAFSGGGIRSATFNLGILRGLASGGLLPRVDYLSSVSGGSYLSGWLAAWVKREGSLRKVVDRLTPTKSPVPGAEEVRPIRWLRMYSNYLAPNASILSTDSWTVGITWLRNTLLNQLVLVLALGSVLALGAALLYGWSFLTWFNTYPDELAQWRVAGFSLVLLLPAAVLASLAMSLFRRGAVARSSGWMRGTVTGLLLVALTGAYVTSGLFYYGLYPGFANALALLLPAAGMTALTLVLIAVIGRYDRCFYSVNELPILKWWPPVAAWTSIALISVVAAGLGELALVGAWKGLAVLQGMQANPLGPPALYLLFRDQPIGPVPNEPSLLIKVIGPQAEGGRSFSPLVLFYLAFIAGPPLVLEAVVLTVVVRMALLGRNFPDERREWWGRMGAVLHLAILVWVVLTGSTLLAREAAGPLAAHWVVATGGWLAVVGKAVQLAFSARAPAQPAQPGSSTWLDYALRTAPYLFGLGLLLLISGALYWLLYHLPGYLDQTWLGDCSAPGVVKLLANDALGLVLRALGLCVVLGALALLLGERIGVNEFSLHHFYRNRLVRAYLGASRPRQERQKTANPFTSFDRRDDLKLCSLRREDPLYLGKPVPEQPYQGPYLIINATLNATKVTDLAQQDRQAESFVFTPHYCGFDFARIRAVNPAQPSFEFGYRPTEHYAYPHDNGPGMGTAMAISGAAANPNEGYHSSPATAFLLTLFNVRLGWWMGNPRIPRAWQRADPHFGLLYLLKSLFGRSDTSDWFVDLSDGGHFDNMGLYELVRRRCRYIILGDGEEDHWFTCQGLANAIRRCRVDFGAELALDVTPITTRRAGYSKAHYAVGTIHYPEDAPGQPSGHLLYLKASLTGDEPTDVREYAQYNRSFPHQSTGDQFFNEAQFESYHQLGLHIFETAAKSGQGSHGGAAGLETFFERLTAARRVQSGCRTA